MTIQSEIYDEDEIDESIKLSKELGIHQMVHPVSVIHEPFITQNPVERCYHCKRVMYGEMLRIGRELGIGNVLDGSNYDDASVYLPGMQALKELDVKTPLAEVGLSKNEIRRLSKHYGLETAHKPASSCLATRIPYGERITRQKLAQVQNGEHYLKNLGFKQYRVRHHDDIARIEVGIEERGKMFSYKIMDMVNQYFKSIGFRYVAIEAGGYRSGNLNKLPTFTSSVNDCKVV